MPTCPDCGNENPDNTEVCLKCGANLYHSPVHEPTSPSPGDLAQLATFHTVSEADMVQELLESNGITTVLHGENDPIGAMSGAEPIILMVEKESLPRATELYEAFFAGSEEVSDTPLTEVD